jgi:hypothetical protein
MTRIQPFLTMFVLAAFAMPGSFLMPPIQVDEDMGPMGLRFVAVVAFLLALFAGAEAQASLSIHVDKTRQRMTVFERGEVRHVWPVSTARSTHYTPVGTWRPVSLRRMHFSSRYENAPMPHSIFYSGHYAIHGTNAVGRLGRPASAGCVRLSPGNAARLFAMVERHGMRSTRITVSYQAPPNSFIAERGRGERTVARAERPERRTTVRPQAPVRDQASVARPANDGMRPAPIAAAPVATSAPTFVLRGALN